MLKCLPSFAISVIICGFFLLKTEAASGKFDYVRPGDWFIDAAACGVGEMYERQSPIDVIYEDAVLTDLPALNFNYIHSDKPFNVTYHGDGSGFALDNPGEFIFSGGKNPGNFVLQQFHMHTPSEHFVEGKKTIMEIHLVHFNQAISENVVAHRNGLAVMGVMFELGKENKFIANLLAKIEGKDFEKLLPGAHNNSKVNITNNITDLPDLHDTQSVHMVFPHMSGLFPADAMTRFYTYPGSLTTPPCYESVTWNLAATRQTMSIEQFITINRLHTSSTNNRPLQNKNSRNVLRTFTAHVSGGFTVASHFISIYFFLSVFNLCM